jgi:hypothetical protein
LAFDAPCVSSYSSLTRAGSSRAGTRRGGPPRFEPPRDQHQRQTWIGAPGPKLAASDPLEVFPRPEAACGTWQGSESHGVRTERGGKPHGWVSRAQGPNREKKNAPNPRSTGQSHFGIGLFCWLLRCASCCFATLSIAKLTALASRRRKRKKRSDPWACLAGAVVCPLSLPLPLPLPVFSRRPVQSRDHAPLRVRALRLRGTAPPR